MADTRHGYLAQDTFIKRWEALGKKAWLHRYSDASDLFGRNKNKLVMTNAQPADFLCAYDGWLGLAEVKSTKNEVGFPLTGIRPAQWVAATRCVAANVPYVFAIENEKTKQWFFVTAAYVLSATGTIKWSSLMPFIWEDNIDGNRFRLGAGISTLLTRDD